MQTNSDGNDLRIFKGIKFKKFLNHDFAAAQPLSKSGDQVNYTIVQRSGAVARLPKKEVRCACSISLAITTICAGFVKAAVIPPSCVNHVIGIITLSDKLAILW